MGVDKWLMLLSCHQDAYESRVLAAPSAQQWPLTPFCILVFPQTRHNGFPLFIYIFINSFPEAQIDSYPVSGRGPKGIPTYQFPGSEMDLRFRIAFI